jgi:uncharacterized protein involved in exopolysaccharide biosynthesis
MLAGILAALIFSLIAPKVYQANTSLQIGIITENGTDRLIESASQIKEKIRNNVYDAALSRRMNIGTRDLPAISVEKKDDEAVVSFFARSSNAELAKKALAELDREIAAGHNEAYESAKKLIESNIAAEINNKERLAAKIASSETEQNLLKNKINLLQGASAGSFDFSRQVALLDAKRDLETARQESESYHLKANDCRREIAVSQNEIAAFRSTAIVKEPYVLENPVSPRTGLNMVFGAALALVASVFFILAADWWRKP